MKTVLPLLLLATTISVGQTPPAGGIKVQGSCDQVITGSGNQITLNCNGISKEKAAQLVRLLNIILQKQLDPERVYTQLDQINSTVGGISSTVTGINSKVTGLDVDLDPLSNMPKKEIADFLDGRCLFSGCMNLGGEWQRAAHAAMLADIKASRPAGSTLVDSTYIARYQKEFAPRLVELHKEFLTFQPDVTSTAPDYTAVSSYLDLAAVCLDFRRIGIDAYEAETERARQRARQTESPK